MESMFEYRTRTYRACVMLLFLWTILTAVGFGTSHWVVRGDKHYGLWEECSPVHGCGGHQNDSPEDEILRVPKVLITLELITLIIACLIALAVNCTIQYEPGPRQRCLEVVVCFAGLLGIVGTTMFWVQKAQLDSALSTVTLLSWSFYLVFFPSCGTLGVAIAMSCSDDIILGIDDSVVLAEAGL